MIASAGDVFAQEPVVEAGPSDPVAESRALFEKARVLAEADRWAEACPYLKAAHELNASGGTAYQLGNCYEKTGRPAEAVPLYRYILERRDRMPPERVAAAEERLRALGALDKPEKKPGTAEPPKPLLSEPRPAPPPAAPNRTPALVVIGAGTALSIAGGVLGALALSTAADARAECGGSSNCAATLRSDVDTARVMAWGANVGIGVGVAVVAVGAVMWFTAGPSRRDAQSTQARALRQATPGLAFAF